MENNQQQILSEIKALMSSVRMQLEQLDAKMAELQQSYEPQVLDTEPIDLELDAFTLGATDDLPFSLAAPVESQEVGEPVSEPVSEQEEDVTGQQDYEYSDDAEDEMTDQQTFELPEDMEGEVDEEVGEVLVEEVEVEEVEVEVEPETADEDIPEALFASIEEDISVEANLVQTIQKTTAVIDVMTTRHAWRHDMPGSQVKDIRAAIALVDRALFINSLFDGDAMAFLETLNRVNQAANLDEVVEYLVAAHPEWNFDSDVVYRFMMAVRRKIN